MKRGATEHPKLKRLARLIGQPIYAAIGLLECLAHWTAKYAPQGDIGRYPNQEIAEGVGWPDDPDALIAVLIDCGLVDECEDHRLLVHDWSEHADEATRKKLARARLPFATRRCASRHVETTSGHVQLRIEAKDSPGPPPPLPEPEPEPEPEPLPEPGVAPLVPQGGQAGDGRKAALAEAGIRDGWLRALLDSPVTESEIREEIARCRGDPNVESLRAVVGTVLADRYGVRLPGRKREASTAGDVTARVAEAMRFGT